MDLKYQTTVDAVKAGDLEELKKMYVDGYTCSIETVNYATAYGHLECLHYLVENGCKWSTETVKYSGIINTEYWTFAKKTDTKEAKFECFKYLFELMYKTNDNILYSLTTPFDIINDSCKYSECPLIKEFIYFIDLDDQLWRRLFTIDLSKYPELQDKVNSKRKEIEELKHVTKDVLENILPSDIIIYCIYPLF